MKSKFTLILSLTLIVLMCFSSCKKALPEDTAAPDPSHAVKENESPDGKENGAPASRDENNSPPAADSNTADAEIKAADSNTFKAESKNVTSQNEYSEETPNETPHHSGGAAGSACYRYISPEELETIADVILVGRYTGQSNQIIPDAQFQETQYGYSNTFVHTDYIFEPINIIKGEVSGNVSIRCEGGAAGIVVSSASDIPSFQKGKNYLIYTYIGKPLVPNDTDHYYIITTHCFEIDESGTVDFSGVNAEDIPKLQAQYDAAVGAVTQDK